MSCELLEHQKVALKWLKDPEADQSKRGGLLAGIHTFAQIPLLMDVIIRISNSISPFIDTMGLGKPVEALALILDNKAPVGAPKTTLIVAPVALSRQWKQEIESKVKPAYKLSTFIYHGPAKKTRSAQRLSDFDVVLTSYGTVSSDHKNLKRKKKAPIYHEIFFRIILDEAHCIRNRVTQCSEAVAWLRAYYRLCMTETPFVNKASELFPLLRFLRIRPYNDVRRFRKDISILINSGPEKYKIVMQRLRGSS